MKIIFLDRDGVINENRDDYVKSIDELKILKNSIYGLRKLKQLGYELIIITNQSVVNRGIISVEKLNQIHEYLLSELERGGCKIKKIYFCPHRPEENCSCRKPKEGMFLQALQDFDIDVSKSWMIGDSEADIDAAKKIGLKSIKMIRNGDLLQAVNKIKNE